MPTWNRQQLAIRAIKSVLRQDYPHWELMIVDDCSSSFEQLQQFVDGLNDPRVRYTRNEFNSGACAVRNQAILQAKGHFITGIDDDDEWTPNRLSVFLEHKHQLVTHAFLYANDYVCEGEVYSQPASLPLYPKSPYSRKLFFKRNIIGNQVFSWAWRFKECLFDTELKAAQDYDIFLRMVTEYGEPWKVEEATQILHINHGEMQITSSPKKFSGYFHFYRKHKGKFDRASKKYQLFTLYQIRNKRMNWRTLLTLLSVRNGKRLADGLRGK
jgi:colanic acid biosynthesis glycosyl transferase WcaA